MPEQITLNDGSAIPQLGLGVWQVDPAITAEVVSWGIEAGYRSIDTAEGYGNEEGVGQAIRKAGVARSELFITSKLRNGAHQRDLALKAFDETMKQARRRAARPVPDPLAGTQPGQICRSLEDAGRTQASRPDQIDRRFEFQPGPSGADHRRDRRYSRGQPDRTPPPVPAARQTRISCQARHPHRKLEPARQRPFAAGSDHRKHRRKTREIRGADNHQMASPGRADRHSEVGSQGAHRFELRCLRFRTGRGRPQDYRRDGFVGGPLRVESGDGGVPVLTHLRSVR